MTTRVIDGEPSVGVRSIAWTMTGLVLLTGAIQIYLIWSSAYLPLVDLPNHMARHYLEALYLSGGKLPPFYAVQYRILPNLGADMVIPVLMQGLSADAACKTFLSVSVFLYWLGPSSFLWRVGGFNPVTVMASLLLLPLAFSSQFFWGFINYYSGFGLAFLALTHYLWLSERWILRGATPRARGRTPHLGFVLIPHLLLHAALVGLLFLWHLAPWGIYGVLMGCHLVTRGVTRVRDGESPKAVLLHTAMFVLLTVPSVVLLALYLTANGGGAVTANWGGVARKVLMPLTLFRAYDVRADAAVGLLWVAAAAVTLGATIRRTTWSWLHSAIVALVLLYVAIPFALDTTSDADSRLLPAILVCVLALPGSGIGLAAPAVKSAISRSRFYLGVGLVMAAILVRYGSIGIAWNGLERRLDEQARAFSVLDSRSRVLPVIALPEKSKVYPESHFLGWAVVSREIFLPTLFAFSQQQPLVLVPPSRFDLRVTGPDVAVDVPTGETFDFVWVFNPEARRIRLPPDCQPVFASGATTVCRLPHDVVPRE